ncbi:transglycosylase SLT domain-containing protein [Mesorhizobium sp. WSM2561]|uniref:transglycosylase SLT domain-containing protein n=1 Tax=Mesorhizobium sp. WSM2561 TaxID=1040985 RepID=UPI00047FEA53|nr:transglycosylase SLT domain-containing protein [Mesorhizobium sp. WSM2561]
MKKLLSSVIAAAAIMPGQMAVAPALAQIAVIDNSNLDHRAQDEQHSEKSQETKSDETGKKKSVVCTYTNKYRSEMFSRSPGEALNHDAENAKLIRYYAQKYGVPEGLALSVAYQESRFDTCAGSHTGVKGVMQLTKGTGRELGFDRDINEQNVEGGVKYLGKGVAQCGATNYTCLASFYNGSNAAEQAQWASGVGRWHGYFNNYVSSGQAPAAAPPAISIVTSSGPGGAAQSGALDSVSKAAADLDTSSAQMTANSSQIDALVGGVGQVGEYKDAWELNSSARSLNADVTGQYINQASDFTALLGQYLSLSNVGASQTARIIAPPPDGGPNPFSCDPAELQRLRIDRNQWLPCASQNAHSGSGNAPSVQINADPSGAARAVEAIQE